MLLSFDTNESVCWTILLLFCSRAFTSLYLKEIVYLENIFRLDKEFKEINDRIISRLKGLLDNRRAFSSLIFATLLADFKIIKYSYRFMF
jgi:hypothetical protein